jgi:ABC-2 type transport system permease protein
MMIKNIITLALNDLYLAFKNKTILLILFIPFFVFISLKLVDSVAADHKKIKIGMLKNELYSPVILGAIRSADQAFTVRAIVSQQEGERLLKEKVLDGVLIPSDKGKDNLSLVVLKKESVQTLSIVESFSQLQKAVEGRSVDWISEIDPLQKSGIQKQTLPTWTLMLVLLVSFIIMPAQIAEEKEKKLLLALLQTPMREIEWLIAKLLLGITLILISVMFLHLMGGFDFGNGLSYLAFFVAGSFCFSSYGILLGFLCRNQASARTLGVIFYLPHLLPSALSDFSEKLTAVAPFLPSYQFYEPIRSILLDDGRLADFSVDFVYLIAVGMTAFFLAYVLLKKRWLM